jgi:hypothetical protein
MPPPPLPAALRCDSARFFFSSSFALSQFIKS